MKEPCIFCEEARRRMRRLAAIMEAWARSRTGVNPQTVAAIDSFFREQYRNADGDNIDAHNHDNQT